METFLDELLTNCLSRLPFNERVTAGLVSKKFRDVSLVLLEKETKLVLKQYQVYTMAGPRLCLPSSIWDNFCHDHHHRTRVQDVLQLKRYGADFESFVLKYCANISVLCVDYGRTAQCVRGTPIADRGLPFFLDEDVLKLIRRMLEAYNDTLTCICIPSYSVIGKWISLPKLRHLAVDNIDEEGLRSISSQSPDLQFIDFGSQSVLPCMSSLPIGLKRMHYRISSRLEILFLFPSELNNLKHLKLEVYGSLADGKFYFPSLESFSIFLNPGTPSTVKSQVIRSLCKSRHLKELEIEYASLEVPAEEWKRLFTSLARLYSVKASLPAEISLALPSLRLNLKTR